LESDHTLFVDAVLKLGLADPGALSWNGGSAGCPRVEVRQPDVRRRHLLPATTTRKYSPAARSGHIVVRSIGETADVGQPSSAKSQNGAFVDVWTGARGVLGESPVGMNVRPATRCGRRDFYFFMS
jgi:hypothetical protein